MNTQDIIATLSPIAAAIGTVIGALKTPRGKKMLISILGSDTSLDTKINAAIHASVEALQAALDARGEELARLEEELANLNAEVARLKTADDWKTARIEELEAEIVQLREENQALRAELAKRRGGRPKKVVEEG
jgi:peptidoglycan hydrolase CwlO-like protein